MKGSKRVLGHPPGGFVLAAGTAYYLGDYFAETTRETEWKVLYTNVHTRWQMTSTDDNYDGTTAEMKRKTFANLAGLATENRMLLGRDRVPATRGSTRVDRRVGPATPCHPNARPASWGSPSDATPRPRSARRPVRRAVTVSPFRGDEGPAMTCVVHCKTDKDCPDGLACNCPDGDGSACRAIASTPEDRMAGICLSVEPAGERRWDGRSISSQCDGNGIVPFCVPVYA